MILWTDCIHLPFVLVPATITAACALACHVAGTLPATLAP